MVRTQWVLVVAVCGAAGCFDTEEMGILEALDALEQVSRSGAGDEATTDVIEVSTDFTIGGALADAAATIASFWESQAPCATVTLADAVLTVDYGDLGDTCLWNGHTYAGVTTVTVRSTTPGELEVDHDWNAFSNGDVTVDGGAVVTWSGNDWTRHVVTDHTVVLHTEDDAVIDVHGDHVSGRIDDGLPVWKSGFTLDGDRTWTTEDGEEWTLTMEGLELMLLDPAPQTGSIAVIAPNGKTLTITYARVDDDTISATLSGLRGGDRVYHISKLGLVKEA